MVCASMDVMARETHAWRLIRRVHEHEDLDEIVCFIERQGLLYPA
ncbi:hypothetical protein [Accumulibacter sp.]|nr:hypothetical protein [Accumulibacter sp.]